MLTFGGTEFDVMGLFGQQAERLYDYVEQLGGVIESKPVPSTPRPSAREQRIRDVF